jgi:hypothetical protein
MKWLKFLLVIIPALAALMQAITDALDPPAPESDRTKVE